MCNLLAWVVNAALARQLVAELLDGRVVVPAQVVQLPQARPLSTGL